MKLSIAELQKVGAFCGEPVEREITWAQGEEEFTATVYVRRMSYKTTVSDLQNSKDGSGQVLAGRIASCICDETGAPVFSVADITGDADPQRGPLDNNLTMALLAVIGEVNGLGKQGPKQTE